MAVTSTGGVVVVPGVVSKLMPSAVLVATVPSGVEPLGKRTLINRSPLFPAGNGSIITNSTCVRPVPMKLGVTLIADTSPVGVAGIVSTKSTSGGRRSTTRAALQSADVLLQLYVSR